MLVLVLLLTPLFNSCGFIVVFIVAVALPLLSHQNANGGWGESYLASVDKEWTETGVQSLQEDSPALGDDASGVRLKEMVWNSTQNKPVTSLSTPFSLQHG